MRCIKKVASVAASTANVAAKRVVRRNDQNYACIYYGFYYKNLNVSDKNKR
tara:strand:+ start:387 stop:539 length:153 start_codon:yes stop_codon:yes gene_type:complete